MCPALLRPLIENWRRMNLPDIHFHLTHVYALHTNATGMPRRTCFWPFLPPRNQRRRAPASGRGPLKQFDRSAPPPPQRKAHLATRRAQKFASASRPNCAPQTMAHPTTTRAQPTPTDQRWSTHRRPNCARPEPAVARVTCHHRPRYLSHTLKPARGRHRLRARLPPFAARFRPISELFRHQYSADFGYEIRKFALFYRIPAIKFTAFCAICAPRGSLRKWPEIALIPSNTATSPSSECRSWTSPTPVLTRIIRQNRRTLAAFE